jgi:DNA-binding MarR family transcriptional regulator
MARQKNTAKNTVEKAATHKDLVAHVGNCVRKMGAQSVVTSQIVAGRFGLHTTDLEVLDLIYLREQASAGELAAATGLTTGSVTALIDRLEKVGYVERHTDTSDRRKVIVRIRLDAIEPIKAVYAPIQVRMFKLWSTFSARELEVIADFLSRSTALAVACAEDIRRSAEPQSGVRRRPRSRRQDVNATSREGVGARGKTSIAASTRKRSAPRAKKALLADSKFVTRMSVKKTLSG